MGIGSGGKFYYNDAASILANSAGSSPPAFVFFLLLHPRNVDRYPDGTELKKRAMLFGLRT